MKRAARIVKLLIDPTGRTELWFHLHRRLWPVFNFVAFIYRILFLRKVLPGGADKSYGIHVAKLAGLPSEIIGRAEEILLCLEEEKISDQSITDILKKKGTSSVYDLPLFKSLKKGQEKSSDHVNAVQKAIENHSVINTIRELDVNNLTPVDALIKIVRWKEDLNCEFSRNEQE